MLCKAASQPTTPPMDASIHARTVTTPAHVALTLANTVATSHLAYALVLTESCNQEGSSDVGVPARTAAPACRRAHLHAGKARTMAKLSPLSARPLWRLRHTRVLVVRGALHATGLEIQRRG